jgi:hypothetical protein
MTLTDLRTLAAYHLQQASSFDSSAELTTSSGENAKVHLLATANRHRRWADGLAALADAIETLRPLVNSSH